MWSIHVFDYGLPSDDFWKLTPAQSYVLGKRFDAQIRRDDLGFGIVSSVVANCHRNPIKQKKAFEPKDFMPVYETKRKMTAQELRGFWDNHVMPTVAAHQRALTKRKGSRDG